jgi:hypothetical protein
MSVAEIYDNFLSPQMFQEAQKEVMSNTFPWYINNFVVNENDSEEAQNLKNYQLIHNAYSHSRPNSHAYDILLPLLNEINPYSIIRVKLNCNFYTEENYEHGMHVDILDLPKHANAKTAVFYFNTNNGYTKIESSGEKIESVENRLVVFDANERHTGSTPTNAKARYVLNVNYIPF